jgi:tetratricopeptide (TPR) repeat protein
MLFGRKIHRWFEGITLLILVFVVFALSSFTIAQSGTNTSGNGGKHTIQGQIYVESGRRANVVGLKVTLRSLGLGDMSVFVDSNSTFSFRNLVPGSYTVVIEGTDAWEPFRESVYIDDPGSSSLSGGLPVLSAPSVQTVQVFLQQKRTQTLRNEVLNAKWSAIPRDAVQHFRRGLDLMDAGKASDAEAEFRSAVSIAPNFAPAHTGIGTIEQKAGKFESAAEAFKEAVRYDPADYDASIGLGIAYFNLRKFEEAEAPLVNAAYIDQFASLPHYYLGLIYSVKNDVEVAQKAFEKVRELDGGKAFPIIHKYLGRIYMHKQMNKAAITEFETYLNLLPNAKDAETIRKEIAEIKSSPNKAN